MTVEVELFTDGGTQQTGENNYSPIFNTLYEDNRSEILVLSAELIGVGLSKNSQISRLGFLISSVSPMDLRNVKIGIKHTDKMTIPESKFEVYSTFQEVFNSAVVSSASIKVNEWFYFEFNSTFYWNGVDNIIITLIRDDDAYIEGGGWKASEPSNIYRGRFRGYFADSDKTSPFDDGTAVFYSNPRMPCIRFTADKVTPVRKSIIKEDFVDEQFIFPINTSWNGYEDYYTFAWNSGVALDGSLGYLQSTNKSVSSSTSVVVFDVIVDEASKYNVLNIDIAIQSEAGYDLAVFYVLDGDMFNFVSQSNAVSESTHLQTFSAVLENGVSSIGVSYEKDESVDKGLDIVQILSMSLTSYHAIEPESSSPIVVMLEADRQKISDETGVNQSILTIKFDKDVSEYVARLNGADYSTGVLVHQGGAVQANTDALVVIDWNELTSEGVNRINIYGKGLDGNWTEYQG